MNKVRIYLVSLSVAVLSLALFAGCHQSELSQYLKAQPVVTTQPAVVATTTQPAMVPVVAPPVTVTVQPVLHAADVAAALITQNSGLITAILSLLSISAAGHVVNITKTAATAYQSIRSGTATAGSLVQSGAAVAAEVAALDPKAGPVIQKVEQVGAAVVAAAVNNTPPK